MKEEVTSMPSPFPGMNPFLEQANGWHEFHEMFCGAIKRELVRRTPPRYQIRSDFTIYIRELPASERTLLGRPDVHVSSSDPPPPARGTLTLAPAYALNPAVDSLTEQTIEIRDLSGEQVITAIEMLSPANKDPSDDRPQYLRKRLAYIEAGVNLVEIDLLRGGKRPDLLPQTPECDYLVMVTHRSTRHRAGLWPISLREPLPTIPIPLAGTDSDVMIDLQQLLHQVYDESGFERYIYNSKPEPSLMRDDQAWADSLLASINR